MAQRWVDFREVKQAVSIPDVLTTLGLLDRFRQRDATSYVGTCPLPSHVHGPEPNVNQFRIDRKEGVWVWHCFGDCQAGGDVVELVKRLENLSDAHARLWFSRHFGDRLSAKRPMRPRAGTKKADGTGDDLGQLNHRQAPSAHAKANANVSDADLPAKPLALRPLTWSYAVDPDCQYLKDRGLTPATIQRFQLGLVIPRGRSRKSYLEGYVAIPLFLPEQPEDSRPVAYIGRYPGDKEEWSDDEPRYKFPPQFPRRAVVYGLREALGDSRDGQMLVVVEGPFDLYRLYAGGLPNTVAILGAELTDEQAAVLIGTGRPICLMLDGNAQEQMRRAAAKLIRGCAVRVVTLPADTEPEHLSDEKIREMLSFAF